MPNHSSPKKRIRADAKRNLINKSRLSRVKTFIKKLDSDIVSKKSSDELKLSLIDVQSEVMRGVSKGVLNKKSASRKISKLAKKINAVNTVPV